jgi:hypothetical protein
MAWKNNDLKKLKHIIEGIKDENEYKKTGIVFYQFGKHLRNIGEPIIDQHVLRAFQFIIQIKVRNLLLKY